MHTTDTLFEMVRRYIHLCNESVIEPAAYRELLHPEVEQTEYANLYCKKTTSRNFDEILANLRVGREVLDHNSMDIWQLEACGDNTAVAEIRWEGTMSYQTLLFKKGQLLTGNFSRIFEFRDDLIYRIRDYFCYDIV